MQHQSSVIHQHERKARVYEVVVHIFPSFIGLTSPPWDLLHWIAQHTRLFSFPGKGAR
ncbi:uncharacterized protein LAESUDRAFT_422671 [Laetiporus sulphureus 93-53]|uniref:Uncharacterized protein n=1 Tax=Laetiporus sulphureus 93-53 TaxID=1314785 RepID=A0A165GHU6_9APHY|nr:uncharacterized protein LAESUDRAFT_422671 [Laetiporus sulphureus 93-53]KZT10369.1 hypothetical protein LAESUDRAFT_422671 [Laetiporus sulphureus 93-53]